MKATSRAIAPLALAVCFSGCIFSPGTETPDDAATDTGSAEMSEDQPDLGPSDWHLTDFPTRVPVRWQREGVAVRDIVAPLSLDAIDDNDAIAITDDDGNVLDVEIDGNTAWTLIPRFGSVGRIWIYSGGSESAQTQNPWRNGFRGVWHLSADDPLRDSAFNNTLVCGTEDEEPGRVEGIVGDGLESNEFLPDGACRAPRLYNTEFPQDESTVEIWFRADDLASLTRDDILFGNPLDDALDSIYLRFEDPQNSMLAVGASHANSSDGTLVTIEPPEGFHHIALTAIKKGSSKLYFTIDGKITEDEVGITGVSLWGPEKQHTRFAGGWNGAIDEMRVHSVARSRDYIRATWQATSGGIFDYGAPESN